MVDSLTIEIPQNPHQTTVLITQSLAPLQGLSQKATHRFAREILEGDIFFDLTGRSEGYPECIFRREQSLVVDQTHFSSDINQVILTPVRGELSNLYLYKFLKQISMQRRNVGAIFLLNDNKEDTQEKIRYSHGV